MKKEELHKSGWVEQTTYDEPRLSEIAELYRELGFEVHIEPFVLDDDTECAECMRAQPEKYMTIYTRKKADQTDAD